MDVSRLYLWIPSAALFPLTATQITLTYEASLIKNEIYSYEIENGINILTAFTPFYLIKHGCCYFAVQNVRYYDY